VRRQLPVAAVLAAGATVFALTPLVTAQAATTGSAYVWANDPITASYPPARAYQSNSTGAVNTITHDGVGVYTVHLPNLGSPSGTVLVTAYGSSHDRCKVASWGPVGTRQDVHVRCFTVSGAADDTTFTMSYTNKVGDGNSYVWADQPNADQYTPSPQYQADAEAGTVTITREGAGRYRVLLPSSIRELFNAQVTAYGTGPEYCEVESLAWNGTLPVPSREVHVDCFAPSGARADTRFTLTTVHNGNHLGEPVSFASDGYPTMYLLAELPGEDESVPSTGSDGTAFVGGGGTITKNHLATGSYTVHGPVDLSNGDVQVSALGAGNAYCKVESWSSGGGIHVNCFDGDTGAAADKQFTVAFVGAFVIA
jgi:hypothetical protein